MEKISIYSSDKLCKIKDFCDVGDGAHASIRRLDNGVMYLSSKNFKPSGLDLSNVDFISETDYNKYFTPSTKSIKQLCSGDVLFGIIGSLGTPYVFKDSDRFGISSSVAILRPKPGLISQYLYYFMTSVFFQQAIDAIKSGVAQGFLSIEMIKNLPLIMVEEVIQQQIAAILSAYDNLIENNNQRIALLEKAAEEIYREWFVRLRFPGWEQAKFVKGLPDGWERTPIAKISNEIRGNVKIKSIEPTTKYLGLEHLPRKSIAILTFDTVASVQSDKLLFKKRDILFGKIRPYLHKVALAHFSGACSSDTIIIRPKKKDYEGFLLFTVFSETFIELATVSSKGTKMPRADWSFLKKLEILMPPEPILQKYQAMFDAQFELITKLLTQNDELKKARDMLLPRLISGKLPVENLDIRFPQSMSLQDAAGGEAIPH